MNEKFFKIGDLQNELDNNKCFNDCFETEQKFRCESLKKVINRMPENHEIFFIETLKSFSAFTFIVLTMKLTGYIRHLYIATYSTNDRIINALVRYKQKGQIGSIHLHISETIKFRMPEVYERLMQLQSDGVIELSFAWSHKKITCMETQRGCFVVEGSGNYGENAMEEQYILLKSKEVYEFRSGCKAKLG